METFAHTHDVNTVSLFNWFYCINLSVRIFIDLYSTIQKKTKRYSPLPFFS